MISTAATAGFGSTAGDGDRPPALRPAPMVHWTPRATAAAPVLLAAQAARRATLGSRRAFRLGLAAPSAPLERLGAWEAWRAAVVAMRTVPAYADHVAASGWRDDPRLPLAQRLASLPETDKASYVVAHDVASRCRSGRVPDHDVEVDESSGSSGRAHQWVRSRRELRDVHRTFSLLAEHLFGGPLVTVNAFSMGAWATGTNVSAALCHNGILKSTGPDVDRVLAVLDLLGTQRTYLVCGYPPFLREVLDAAEARGIDLSRYRLVGAVGGEGMTEALRTRLETRFAAVYSAYGASDLDIGVAAETPVSVFVRQAASLRPELAEALFGEAGRLPMLFQYNPLDYHVESVAGAHGVPELVVTVNRRTLLSPRIRYNVHDEGGALPWARVLDICRQFGVDALAGAPRPVGGTHPRLPFLFVRGRSDSTLSFMGANIYPEDVEAGLYADVDEQRRLGAFALELVDAGAGRQRPCVHVEVLDGAVDDEALRGRITDRVCRSLAAASADFRTALAESGEAARPEIRLHLAGTGPFTENARRIKRRYVIAGAR